MFNVGDKVFYPVFGVGVIINIEEKNFHGINGRYYMIKLIKNNMIVMIPEKDVNNKIRNAVSIEEAYKVIEIIKSEGEKLPNVWSKRARIYNDAIKEGDIYKMALALRDIAFLAQYKKLSKSEENYFYSLLNYISDEIALVLSKEGDEIYNLINEGLKQLS